jgi:hypothetical protein
MNVYVWLKADTGKSLIAPSEFLTWAKKDIQGGDRRAIANALTNTKRALHARIDEILYAVRVRYANDWNRRPDTSLKLEVLKHLKIPFHTIVKVLTGRRNDLEHRYLLPTLDQVRVDVETAELWLDNSKSYLHPSIVLAGLSVKSFGVSSSARSKKNTVSITFDSLKDVKFFCDTKRVVINITSNGNSRESAYKTFKWKDLIKLQYPYLSENGWRTVPSMSIANKIYRAYEQWLGGDRPPSFKVSSRWR